MMDRFFSAHAAPPPRAQRKRLWTRSSTGLLAAAALAAAGLWQCSGGGGSSGGDKEPAGTIPLSAIMDSLASLSGETNAISQARAMDELTRLLYGARRPRDLSPSTWARRPLSSRTRASPTCLRRP